MGDRDRPLVAGCCRSSARSVSWWAPRCAWRDAVAFSNRSRSFVSLTGPSCCSLLRRAGPVASLGARGIGAGRFAVTYSGWKRGLPFTVINAGCVLALGALARFQNVSHIGRAIASRYPECDLHPSIGGPCPSPPGDRVEQRRGAANVGATARRARRNSRRQVNG